MMNFIVIFSAGVVHEDAAVKRHTMNSNAQAPLLLLLPLPQL